MVLSILGKLFGLKPLTAKAARDVVVFTVIEVLTLVYWLIFALKPGRSNQIIAVVILAAGLLLEHYFATQTGQQDGPAK